MVPNEERQARRLCDGYGLAWDRERGRLRSNWRDITGKGKPLQLVAMAMSMQMDQLLSWICHEFLASISLSCFLCVCTHACVQFVNVFLIGVNMIILFRLIGSRMVIPRGKCVLKPKLYNFYIFAFRSYFSCFIYVEQKYIFISYFLTKVGYERLTKVISTQVNKISSFEPYT